MKLNIRFKGFKNKPKDYEYVHRRIWFCLNRFAKKIDSIRVHIEDVNGPRGGVDQKCGILVKMRHGSRLWVDEIEIDWQYAVDHAAQRIGNAVSRSLESLRALRFQSGMVPQNGEGL